VFAEAAENAGKPNAEFAGGAERLSHVGSGLRPAAWIEEGRDHKRRMGRSGVCDRALLSIHAARSAAHV